MKSVSCLSLTAVIIALLLSPLAHVRLPKVECVPNAVKDEVPENKMLSWPMIDWVATPDPRSPGISDVTRSFLISSDALDPVSPMPTLPFPPSDNMLLVVEDLNTRLSLGVCVDWSSLSENLFDLSSAWKYMMSLTLACASVFGEASAPDLKAALPNTLSA